MIRAFSGLACLLFISVVPSWAADTALDPASLMPNEWTEFRYERFTVIRANPELTAEDKQLNADIQAQAATVDTTLVQAYPGLAPFVSKLQARDGEYASIQTIRYRSHT